jgi:hypothetical protein
MSSAPVITSDAYDDATIASSALYADAATGSESVPAPSTRRHQQRVVARAVRMHTDDDDDDDDNDASSSGGDSDAEDGGVTDTSTQVLKKRRTEASATDSSAIAHEEQSRQMVEHLLHQFTPSAVLRALLSTQPASSDAFRHAITAYVQRSQTQHSHLLQQQQQQQHMLPLHGEASSAYYWNNSFQAILALDDAPSKFRKLRNLAHDFTHAASVYGRIIISERFLPVEHKTIKPSAALGGTAGGLKYVCGGMLFKFCVDVCLSNGGWMYGGALASDERAMKSGGHELKSIINLLSLSPKDTTRVHFPMMAVVDYRGFRLLVESLLPIDRSTCVYGSPDGGATMYASEPRLNASMRCLAQQLNLAEHQVGDVRIAGPGDVEGHVGRDGRFYLIDLARIFPPQAPLRGRGDRRHVFYELLRPEFVRNWTKQPLCSDAFTRWLERDADVAVHNAAVVEASRTLYNKTIPNFAEEVPALLLPAADDAANERERVRLISQQLEAMLSRLHNRGINVRHLGLVRACIAPEHWQARSKLLSEMTARALKCIVQQRLREKMRGLAFPGEEPYRQELILYLNLVLGNLGESNAYWTGVFDGTEREGDRGPVVIGAAAAAAAAAPRALLHSFGPSFKSALLAKFGPRALCADSLDERNDLRTEVGLSAMLARLVGMLGVVLTETCLTELYLRPNSLRLVGADVVDTGVRVKHMGIVNQADARALHLEAQERMKRSGGRNDDSNEVDRLLDLARRLYVDALSSMPDSFDILSGLGDVLFDLAMRLDSDAGAKRYALLQEALGNYAESMRCKDFRNVGGRVLVRLVRVLCELASDACATSEASMSYCNQAAVYADDATRDGKPSADGRPIEAALDGFIKHCLGAPRDLSPTPRAPGTAAASSELTQSLERSQLLQSTDVPQDGVRLVLTYMPPRLFVALLTVATIRDNEKEPSRLQKRLMLFARNLRLTALERIVPASVTVDPQTGAVCLDDGVVERVDLSAFAHLTMPTINMVRELFPDAREMWLLPSRPRGRSVFALSRTSHSETAQR